MRSSYGPDHFTVAIDGPAASGKGTLARGIAETFDFAHLDSGLIYRAIGAKTLEGQDAIVAAQNFDAEDTKRDGLRTSAVSLAASEVAAIPEVRAVLLDFQKQFARRLGGAILDGRDIGTVICPEAEVKLYVTASAETRAKRRLLELRETNSEITYEQVLEDVKTRDERDATRASSPLRPAHDAIMLDTSELSIETALELARSHVREALERLDQAKAD